MNRVVAAAIAAVLLVPGESAAHRLDEYLQAARLSLSRGHVTLEMDLTPGASIAAAIVALVDRDGDGAISPIEAQAYGQTVLADLELELDGRPVALAMTRVETPSIDEMRDGVGTIQLRAAGDAGAVGAGRRLLHFRNSHQPVASVYLVNALMPEDPDMAVVRQSRDRQQQEIRVEYRVSPRWPTQLLWLAFGVTSLSMFTTLRRAQMLKVPQMILLLLWAFALAGPVVSARQQKQTSAPEIAFDSVPDFLKLPPGENFGEVPGVAVDSKGRIYVFSRSGSAAGPAFGPTAAKLFQFGPKGEFVREIGKDLYGWAFAHSVRIDKNDNIWAIDKGSDMIIKFNRAGRVEWVFGRRQESADGAEPHEHPTPPLAPQDGRFRQPTDVAWDSQGNTYISDGYVNSRIAKIDKNGDWVKSFGEPGTGPGQFRTPHAIAIDAKDNIYVGDRGNQRVQIFNTDGKYLREWKIEVPPDYTTRAVNGATPPVGSMNGVGAPNSLCITPGANQVIFLGESTWPGRIFKLTLEGKVLGVIGKSGRNLKQFSGGHALACPSENEIYVAESSNWRVQKLLLRPTPAQTSAGR